jgi:hypothetical protein
MKMVHPEIQAVADVLDRMQFNSVYAPRGWELLDSAAEYANNNLGRFVRSADDLSKDEARALIASRGGDYPDATATEAEVRETYADMFADRAPVATPNVQSATGIPIKLYDPSEHYVDGEDGVLAYLEGATEDERLRVMELEESGKNRKSIVEWTPTDSADAEVKE